MRTILFGASDISIAVAEKLSEIGCQPVGLITVPQKFNISYSSTGVTNYRASDMVSWAKKFSIPYHFYKQSSEAVNFSRELDADFAIVAGWYHNVDISLRSSFKKGCIGLHASLLPKYRGGAPLNWAILNGDKNTGVTMFSLCDDVDAGEIYGQESFPIFEEDYISHLVKKSHDAAIRLIGNCVPLIANGSLNTSPQLGEPSYSMQRTPEDGLIDWHNSAEKIARLIRAVSSPYPGAFSSIAGKRFIIWKARAIYDHPKIFGVPGQIVVLKEFIRPVVVTGKGLLLLEEVESDDVDIQSMSRLHQRRFDIHCRQSS